MDDQPEDVRRHLAGTAPAVVAIISDNDDGEQRQEVVLLLGPEALEACAASPQRLVTAITDVAHQLRLTFMPSTERPLGAP